MVALRKDFYLLVEYHEYITSVIDKFTNWKGFGE